MEFEPPVSSESLQASPQNPLDNTVRTDRPSRNWSMEPTKHDIPVQTILKKMTDPTSIWCLASASALSFIVASLVLLFFKPNVIVDQITGRVCPKKIIFISLAISAAVFGISFYLRRRYS